MAAALCLLMGMVMPRAEAFSDADAVRVIGFARTQLADTTREMPDATWSPKAALPDGTWSREPNTDLIEWTQGFFPGSMWFMYQVAGEPLWRDRADRWTRALELQKTNRQTHDLGFKLFLSFGNAYRLTGDTYYRGVLLTAAESLASRYNSQVGIISCCDWNSDWQVPLVTDTMMNLELLLWASRNGGRAEWRTMAVNHALKTLQDAVRADGSSFHYVDYNRTTGAIRSRGTYQGYSASSTWARGHAWLIYGYTMVYRYTGDVRMLEAARKVTDWYLAHLPADRVPNWDFNAPSQQKDSSAAAIVASALLELSALETDATRKTRYRDAALRTLDVLVSPAYYADGTNSPGLLLHGVGNHPAGREINTTLIYGDYYFLEAVLRFNPKPPYPWYSKTSFYQSQHLLGSSNTGVRTIEFDVNPRATTQDGTVGYTDSSTAVTGYSVLNMTVRMNTSGYFDVRNGGGYAALTRVNWVSGQTYHVRIRADLAAQRYSVWVRPPGGSEVQIASNYAFRTGAPAINDIGRASVRTVIADSDFRVLNHSITAGSSAVSTPSRPLEEQGLSTAFLDSLGEFESREAVLTAGDGNDSTASAEGDGAPGVIEDATAQPETPPVDAAPEVPEVVDERGAGCASAAAVPLPLAVLMLLGLAVRRRRAWRK
ncbi:glycoside hydrolase family 88 protein [Myxococcus sp. RHSTA-1-4]|uniref:glycoside hydrolase family 88 protein n=1 Tax=Myxococcus sp. RHSTA-1-4 TaxID=2874601 RepID=UPI001CBA71BA|nr:glycoside hydrolase family 88 protein [Myxococcus sp. RHSTA-1-4]MBZ4421785.1 glycoside hydrolase family 88 protein [Myxococcus sp. RHSTA-1-4]